MLTIFGGAPIFQDRYSNGLNTNILEFWRTSKRCPLFSEVLQSFILKFWEVLQKSDYQYAAIVKVLQKISTVFRRCSTFLFWRYSGDGQELWRCSKTFWSFSEVLLVWAYYRSLVTFFCSVFRVFIKKGVGEMKIIRNWRWCAKTVLLMEGDSQTSQKMKG